MVKDKPLKLILWSIVFAIGLVLSLAIGGFSSPARVSAANAYDISEYQGYVNDNQASQLKNEVNFMILKAENGGLRTDPQFNHNAYEMTSHNIPYGAYDYSLYANPAQAQSEAQALYQRAPQASFYVNDSEENDAGSQLDASTQAWANEIHQLTKKPAVLYSSLSFMSHFAPQTRNAYDALWVADYGAEPDPAYHYDLWQSTDHQYSPALGQNVDASVFPDGNNKPLSFWTGYGTSNNHVVTPVVHHNKKRDRNVNRPIVKPRRHRHQARKAKSRATVKPARSKSRVNKRRHRRRYRKERRNRASKRDRRKKNPITYNPRYYRSKKIHYLQVINPGGINLYTMNGHYFGSVAKGTVLNVYRFMTVHHRSTGYMTKAVGIHYGQYDLFTSRKDLVKWYPD